jgi:hypothetical protein
MYIYLEDVNDLRGKKLRVGQIILLPLLYELCESVVLNDEVVRPGDTIYGIAKRKGGTFKPKPSNSDRET